MKTRTRPNALTIAGSDSSGGAGIQADIKAMSASGVYAASVLTALTAQNTQAVTGIHEVPAEFVGAQLDAVFSDLRVDATKVGMLATAQIVRVVAERLRAHGAQHIVVDPVMVAKSGDRLLHENAVRALKEELLPLAEVLTPNLPEAGDILGQPAPSSYDEMEDAARAIAALGPRWVLIKGGHSPEQATSADVLVAAEPAKPIWLDAPRIDTKNTHGTGCSLSSAIAAELAQGRDVPEAVRRAKTFVSGGLAHADALAVGSGHGPIHHFYSFWEA